MSVQAISWVLENSESTGASRLVLISIANHASHDGDSCWPAVATIAREAGISERAVQYSLANLEKSGEVRIDRGTGRGNTHRYFMPKYQQWVQTVRLLSKKGANHSTIEAIKGANCAEKGERIAPEPSLTVKEKENRQLVPVSIWLSFVEMRKKIRKPLTDTASELIRRELEKLKVQGYDPIEVLEQSIRNSWQDVFPLREQAKKDGIDERELERIRALRR